MQKKYKRGNGLVIFPIDFQLLPHPYCIYPFRHSKTNSKYKNK